MNTPEHPPLGELPASPQPAPAGDWAEAAAEEIADIPDACLHIDESGSNGMGWHCKRLPEPDVAAIIRKHAPTQQPAEQPEAGGELLGRIAMALHNANNPAHVGLPIPPAIMALYLNEAAEILAATPRPESPDARRGEVRDCLLQLCNLSNRLDEFCEHPEVQQLMFDSTVSLASAHKKAKAFIAEHPLSSLPAKGPGPGEPAHAEYVDAALEDLFEEKELMRIRWSERVSHVAARLCEKFDIRMRIAPPPASHSKQREQQP